LLNDVNASLIGLPNSADKSDFPEEKEVLKKRREETQSKMDEIEKLFMDLDADDNSKRPKSGDDPEHQKR
jgi:hypothetical protein